MTDLIKSMNKAGEQHGGHTSHSTFRFPVPGGSLPLLKPTDYGIAARARGTGGKRRSRSSMIA